MFCFVFVMFSFAILNAWHLKAILKFSLTRGCILRKYSIFWRSFHTTSYKNQRKQTKNSSFHYHVSFVSVDVAIRALRSLVLALRGDCGNWRPRADASRRWTPEAATADALQRASQSGHHQNGNTRRPCDAVECRRNCVCGAHTVEAKRMRGHGPTRGCNPTDDPMKSWC